ncbi:peptidylprolyl isomerase [Floccifex sp.]|uniref:peptidylprolyl isomerase n=1 Tax=Floccifex sp. TaxID=2815810 RepID=UPI003F119A34
MEKIIREAKNGKREAVLELYQNHKSIVYFICDFLMENKSQTDFVFQDVFDEIWKILIQKNIETTTDFTNLCIRTSIRFCQSRLFMENPHCIKEQKPNVSQNINIENIESNIDFETIQNQLKKFDSVSRFVLKTYLCSNFNIRELSDCLSIDEMSYESYIQYGYQTIPDMKKYRYVVLIQKEDPFQTSDAYCIEHIESITKKEKNPKTKLLLIPLLILVIVAGYFIFKPEPVYFADIDIEGYGEIVVQLDSKNAPKTVENFVELAQSGFYDGLTFHRIMDGFMMQGGDPNGDGTGGSSQTIKGEFSENGIENNLSHIRGTISMARSSDMDSASSQFFIVQEDSTFLDGQYAAFGTVLSGMDIVDEICESADPTDNNGTIEKDQQPVIKSITIRKE